MPITRKTFHRRIVKRMDRLAMSRTAMARRSHLDLVTVDTVLSAPGSVPFNQLIAVGRG